MSRQQSLPGLIHLARLHGVQPIYEDVWGTRRQSADDAVFRTLQLLGAPLDRPDDIPDALRHRRQQLWQRVVEPVVVAWDDSGEDGGTGVGGSDPCSAWTIRLRVPVAQDHQRIDCRIRLENGQQMELGCRVGDLPRGPSRQVEGVTYAVRHLPVTQRLPAGYHQARLEFDGRVWQSLVIAAPRRAYAVPPGQKQLLWGVFLPLYAAHRQSSRRAGDFSDLEVLMEWTARSGGSLVATLPLLTTLWERTDDPSPYAPASRLFWNEFYLDVRRVPELGACPAAQALLDSPVADAAGGPRESMVDYTRQMQQQRAVLELLAERFFDGPAGSQAELERRCREYPELEMYARFRAVGEQQGSLWPHWPRRLQLGEIRPTDYDPRIYRYHLYTQWQVERQLHEVTDRARELKLLWYLDFPLGVTRTGYDAWRERETFIHEASGGAPPDAFFTRGQDWGFPPLHPERLRQQGYRHLIAALRRHLEFARVLRFDHVMSLHRLYWIPHGMGAGDGVYVRFAAEELFALLTVESHRYQAQIVGENLGTVPEAVNRALVQHGLRDMYVLQYEMNPERKQLLRPIPDHSVASINTHDMPQFAAYWHGRDVDDRVDLGLLAPDEADGARRERAAACRKLLDLLHQRGLLPADNTEPEAVLEACLALLASSPAPMMLVNLEDLWLEAEPQNTPGTHRERPNWRRTARYSLEEIGRLPAVQRILATVDRCRRQAQIRAEGDN